MKTARWIRAGLATVATVLSLGLNAEAQLSPGSPGGVNAALTKLFGPIPSFTARVEVQVLESSRQEVLRMPMNFAFLDGKVRLEIDVAQIRNRNVSPRQLAALRQAGRGKIVTVIRPDKRASYIIYPGARSYSIVPMPREEANAVGKNLKVEKTALGKETLDGHPCVRNQVAVRDADRVVLEATTWNASDLKDFPLQIQTKDKGNTSILRFSKIQFINTDARQFELPGSYTLAE